MCARGRAGVGRATKAQTQAFTAVAMPPISQGPSHGGLQFTETQARQADGPENNARVKANETKDVPLPPSPVITPEDVEQGEIAATARADAVIAATAIPWTKLRIAAPNDLAAAKSLIEAAGEANPALLSRPEEQQQPYSLLPPPRFTPAAEAEALAEETATAAATITTIPSQPQQTEPSRSRPVQLDSIYLPHPGRFRKAVPAARPVILVGDDLFVHDEVNVIETTAGTQTKAEKPAADVDALYQET